MPPQNEEGGARTTAEQELEALQSQLAKVEVSEHKDAFDTTPRDACANQHRCPKASVYCEDCQEQFCEVCDMNVHHRSPAHTRLPF
jgi:hypothetical protein